MKRVEQVTMTLGIDVMAAVRKLAKPRKRSELVDGVLREKRARRCAGYYVARIIEIGKE